MKFKYTQKEYEAIGEDKRCSEMIKFFTFQPSRQYSAKAQFERWLEAEITAYLEKKKGA